MRTHTKPAVVDQLMHLHGCPAASDADLAFEQVEWYPATRPARTVNQAGVAVSVPAHPIEVAHCCTCGALAYSDRPRPGT